MKIRRLHEIFDFEEEADDLYIDINNVCYNCGSRNIEEDFFEFGVPNTIQTYFCKDCKSHGCFHYDVKLLKNVEN